MAVAQPQLPAASDLDFSQVPARIEPVKPQVVAAIPVERKIAEPTHTQAQSAVVSTQVAAAPAKPMESRVPAATKPAVVVPAKPQFLSAAPTYVASATPIVVPAKPEQLVPANVAQPTAVAIAV